MSTFAYLLVYRLWLACFKVRCKIRVSADNTTYHPLICMESSPDFGNNLLCLDHHISRLKKALEDLKNYLDIHPDEDCWFADYMKQSF